MSSTGISPYQYVEATGVIVPDTSDLQAQIASEYTAALPDLNVTNPQTPQAVIITAETLVRAEAVANNAAVANQINPNEAGGIFLESICAITGLDVPEGTNTIVAGVRVTGQPGYSVPAGGIAATTPAGDKFQSTATATFDSTGMATVDFEALEQGPVPCPVGALTQIVSGVLGWETVYNSAAGTLGVLPLSDPQLRALRNNTLAGQGSSLAESVTSALYTVSGVLSVTFRENKKGTPQTIDGIYLVKNSVWACVDGGADTDIATALLASVSGGCDYNGATVIGVIDPYSGQTYLVNFDRPASIGVLVKATVRLPNSSISSLDVQAAILAYAAGQLTGQPGFVTGGAVSPFDIAGAIISQIPGVFVPKVEVGLAPAGALQTTEIVMALNQKASLSVTNIQIAVVN